MVFETNKDKGRAGLALGIAYFGANGYVVNIPLNDTQWYDFVVEKDGQFLTVQCKATGSENNVISLRSSGGTKGTPYDNVLEHPVDLLFCLDKDANMYVIPVPVIREFGSTRQVTLRKERSIYANKNALDTSQYLVTM